MITKQRILYLVILCALSLSMSSCLEDIDLDTGERILYVYCILDQGPEQELELSYCAPTGGTSSPVGEGVVISLYDNGAPVGDFTRVSETKWNLDFSPEGGHTYRLEVTVPGEEQLTAETTFPTVSVLQEVWYPTDIEYPAGQVSTGYYRLFELNADEDQILWCVFENPEDGKKAFSDYVVTDHPGVDPRGETSYPWDFNSQAWSDFYVNLWGLEVYFSEGGFFRGADDFTAPFLHERVVRILHPGGFARSEERIRKYRHDDPIGFIPLEEGYASGFGLVGVNKKGGMPADLVVCSVSSEYDAYLMDYYFFRSDTDDFTDTVYRRNHYSNIRNGTGIFGASIEYRRPNKNLDLCDPRYMG
ncbi:MAG: DUF4249 family protein [Bacteroidales bacterium]|nr:DUF4249 family protein [Bacteroidales bacterium]